MTPVNSRAARSAAWMLALGLAGALAASADTATRTRNFRQAFPGQAAELRLANLAGRVELTRGQGNQVVVDVTVHAAGSSAGETRKLLDGMKWVRSKGSDGRDEWALSYPVDDYSGFHYPRPGRQSEPSFLSFLDNSYSSAQYRGKRVRIYAQKRSGTPTLYADLKIALPANSNLAVRNAVGAVHGQGQLEGTLTVDTGSGDVSIAGHAGRLTIDTGSGDVTVGSTRGESSIDTGSGDVVVRRLVGNGRMDTGSGDVTVENVSAGGLTIDTGSGDVVVRKGVAARVAADTGSGNVSVLDVEVEELQADTGSGDVTLRSSLAQARRVVAETGSGDVEIYGGPQASFDVQSSHGSGELLVRYDDADLRRSGRRVTGARRGDGRTTIRVTTGSGDCVIGPKS